MSGISRDIEIYETPDLTESDKNFEDDRKSQAIDVLDSGFQTSFGKFKKKKLLANKTNFSDTVNRPVQYGFRSEPEDYEIEGIRGDNETIMQRYHRLKHEVADLINDVEQVKESEKEFSGATPADVVNDLQQLQTNLHQLELDRLLTDSKLSGSDDATYYTLFKELQVQLAAAKSQPNSESSNGAVYEIYTNIESAKFGHLSKLSDVEKRLATLEMVVGKVDSKGSVVAAGLDADYKDISSAVLGLQSKIALLDSSHIASITGQLQNLMTVLQQVQQKVREGDEKKDDLEQKTKVSEALETVSSVSPLITLIPDVVNRLHTLKDLHEHASQLTSTASTISNGQEIITDRVSTLKSLLEQVQSSIGGNLDTLQSNISSLETRIKELQQK